MTKLFISHSSADNESTEAVAARLREQGYEAIFIDFDPVTGLSAGRKWEQEIYLHLKSCQALIVLLSPHSVASKWCFAEMALAKALGKQLFPIWIEECVLPEILSDTQAIDLKAEPERGYERLFTGLKKAGLDAQSSFHWDSTRPPYPGLESFQEEDAAVFFGRDEEIHDVLSALERRRLHGEPRILLLIGASGSGKSSVVRAGILPRLKKLEHWYVLPPWRPGARPADRLDQVLEGLVHPQPDDFSDRIRLLTIDQLEEALAQDPSTDSFWTRLLSFVEEHGDSIQILATLRSDFLRDLQNRPEIERMDFEVILIGPMPKQRPPEVIEKPAAKAGLELEAGLATRLVEDTSTEDALPLLSFTLRNLWELRQGSRLTLESYKAFGSLEGAVGRIADEKAGVNDLSEEEAHAVKSAFLDLVRVNEDGHFFRQRAAWDQLPEAARPVLNRLVRTRLLTKDGNHLEVTHEALFRTWPQLADWLNEEQEFLLWRRRFRDKRREWQRLDEDAGALLRGGALAEAERWAAEKPTKVDAEDKQYLIASRHLAAKQEQRERRRFRVALGAAMALLILAGLASWQWQVSVEQRKVAEARQLAATAETGVSSTTSVLNRATLTDYQPTFSSMGVATATTNLLRSLEIAPTPEAFKAWIRVMQSLPLHPPEIIWESSGLETFTFSPDGETVVLSRHAPLGDPEIFFVDMSTRKILKRFPTKELAYQLAVSPDGRFFVAGFVDTLEARRMDDGVVMQRWPQPGNQSVPPQIADDPSALKHWKQPEDQNLAFSPDGRWLAVGGRSRAVLLRTVDWEEQKLEGLVRGSSPTFSSDGRWFSLQDHHHLRVWETETGRFLGSKSRAGSPAGLFFCSSLLFDFSRLGLVNIWGLEERGNQIIFWKRSPQLLPFLVDKTAVACEHLGNDRLKIKILLGPSRGSWRSPEVFSYKMVGLQPIATLPQLGNIKRIDFHPDRDDVVTQGPQSFRLWPRPKSSPLSAEIAVPDQRIEGLSFDQRSERLMVRTEDEDMIQIDVGTWEHIDSKTSFSMARPGEAETKKDQYSDVLSPDGRWRLQTLSGTLRSAKTSVAILRLKSSTHEDLIYDFSPDGKWLAFVGDQETIQVLPLHEQEWTRLLCNRSRYLFPYEIGSARLEQPAICKDLLSEDDLT